MLGSSVSGMKIVLESTTKLSELKNKDENLIFLGKIKLIIMTDFMGCFMHGNVLEHARLSQDCVDRNEDEKTCGCG